VIFPIFEICSSSGQFWHPVDDVDGGIHADQIGEAESAGFRATYGGVCERVHHVNADTELVARDWEVVEVKFEKNRFSA
jgi:hypothetical protein